jgi:putative tricarboxylic transport membrane protein
MAVELIANLFWVLIGTAIAWLAREMGIGTFGEPGAGMISVGLGALIAMIGAWGLAKILVKGHQGEATEPWTWEIALRIASVVGSLIVYVALFEKIGFLILTTVLLTGLLGFLGGIRWRWAAPLAVILAASNYAVFKLLLGTQLPAGVLG